MASCVAALSYPSLLQLRYRLLPQQPLPALSAVGCVHACACLLWHCILQLSQYPPGFRHSLQHFSFFLLSGWSPTHPNQRGKGQQQVPGMETPCNSNIGVLAQVLGDAGQLSNAFRIITATVTVRLMGGEVKPQASHPALEKREWLLQSRLLLGEKG